MTPWISQIVYCRIIAELILNYMNTATRTYDEDLQGLSDIAVVFISQLWILWYCSCLLLIDWVKKLPVAEYLRQVGSEDELRWKREGTVVEESDSEHEPRDAVLSLAELTEEQAEIERWAFLS